MNASEFLSTQPVFTRRLFALLLLIVVVAVVCQAIVLPVGQLILSQDAWRSGAVRQLGYDRGIVATGPRAREQLQQLQSAPSWRSLFQDNPVGPNDQLKTEVAQALSATGAATLHLTSLPAENAGGLRKYGLRVVATLDAGQLKNFLVALRTRAHYLRVERLSLTAPIVQSPNSNPPLQLKVDIFGYAKAGAVNAGSARTPARRASQ
jgi:hypothetical protein